MKMKTAGVLCLLLMLCGAQSWAGSRENEFGINLDFQSSGAAMGDFNSTLTSNSFSPMGSAFGWGLGLSYGFTPHIEAGISYDFHSISSVTGSVFGYGSWSDYNVSLGLSELQFKLGYVFPDVLRHLDLKANVGVAFETMSGSDNSNVPDFQGTNFTASGIGMIYSVGAEYFWFPNASIGIDVGYREANLSPVNLSGAFSGNMQSASGANASADFSGVTTKLGFSFYFGGPMGTPEPVRRLRRVYPRVYQPQNNYQSPNVNQQPQVQSDEGKTITINIPNTDGTFAPVTLTKHGNGYLGPQGEYYDGHPSVEQLKAVYGH